ncbi:hypothetical protein [Pelagovum pacificum]|uniref:LamG domain-containing protein n=1 Tax=Pelagovum pacificum TaxID=2588711 RepID=A0A5C5GGZ1_9RHOB|nr:hypothetical protein [Pelagovum pacificum]QQA43546.1 hypothetical protein I8N54_02920 [Pelagovum pacificum]TNY33317.1 hypothetical protein FHY64_08610 [Pelagovum pacificum]
MRLIHFIAIAALGLIASMASADIFDLSGVCRSGQPDGVRLQEQMGQVGCVDGVLTAEAGPKDGRVGKAALIVPTGRLGPGAGLRISAEVFFPTDSPMNSIILMDAECKYCGRDDNPGLRLYLRDGRLRVDRAKIGERHAWTNDTAPQVPRGRWVELVWDLGIATGDDGRSDVWLDGVPVLQDTGRTTPEDRAPGDAVDRVQIGVTANSNDSPVSLQMRAIRIETRP